MIRKQIFVLAISGVLVLSGSKPVPASGADDLNTSTDNTGGTGSHTHTVANAGSGGAHNNMQPVVSGFWIVYLGA